MDFILDRGCRITLFPNEFVCIGLMSLVKTCAFFRVGTTFYANCMSVPSSCMKEADSIDGE